MAEAPPAGPDISAPAEAGPRLRPDLNQGAGDQEQVPATGSRPAVRHTGDMAGEPLTGEVSESVRAAPAAPLRGLVSWYSGYRQAGVPPGRHRGLPSRT